MTNVFLKVNKDLFKLGLNPTEILVLAQIIEFQTNTGECYKSDKAMADDFGVSESTISRALKALEGRGFIKRTTKNIKGGKIRYINVDFNKIATSVILKLDDAQQSNCLLTTVNLLVDNRQNDLIKDNIKEKDEDAGLRNPANAGVAQSLSVDGAGVVLPTAEFIF